MGLRSAAAIFWSSLKYIFGGVADEKNEETTMNKNEKRTSTRVSIIRVRAQDDDDSDSERGEPTTSSTSKRCSRSDLNLGYFIFYV